MTNNLDASSKKSKSIPQKQIKLSKWGNSQGIRLSKEDLNKAGILMEDTLNVYIEENKVILEKTNKYHTLEELFADYDGEYTPKEWDTGDSMGEEI